MKKQETNKRELDVDSIGNQTDKITPEEEHQISNYLKLQKEKKAKLAQKKKVKAE